ncbi:basic salivary proline-rich protein 1-like [Acomys russatus]|uniref:basic salivary proline-rich protein 1-like n=1 Tax=Acomys russatus TaxID=60746 RepID=UPI0021E2F242|nr:basic salivary proline-rich protein 1-like [Acomys russatus]
MYGKQRPKIPVTPECSCKPTESSGPQPSADPSSTWRRPGSPHSPGPHPGLPRSSAALGLELRQMLSGKARSTRRSPPGLPQIPAQKAASVIPSPNPPPRVPARGPPQRGSPAFPADANSRHCKRRVRMRGGSQRNPAPPGT